jgi:alpha-tubulin suppressor-like RCC1 family protein
MAGGAGGFIGGFNPLDQDPIEYSGKWGLKEQVQAIAAGRWTGIPTFELYAWGRNDYGQLGLGNTANRSSPVQVGALADWAQFSTTGDAHSLAVTADGKLYAWGRGGNGRLGLGNTVYRSSPVQVGALTTWAQSAASGLFSAALKTDGTLWSWGENGDGQLGQNDTVDRSSPVQIGALTTWASISVGEKQAFAVTVSGELYVWGSGGSGRLGTGNTNYVSSPVQVGSLTNWHKTSSGVNHTLAIKTDGTLWAWGQNYNGALGTNNQTTYSSPVIVGALTSWTDIATGDCFLLVKTQMGNLGLTILLDVCPPFRLEVLPLGRTLVLDRILPLR